MPCLVRKKRLKVCESLSQEGSGVNYRGGGPNGGVGVGSAGAMEAIELRNNAGLCMCIVANVHLVLAVLSSR